MSNKLNIPMAITKKELCTKVETLVFHDKLKYSEAITCICEEKGIDIEDIVRLVLKSPLKKKLELEAMANHIIPDTRGTELSFTR